MSSVVVVGGTGAIGSRVVRLLRARGAEVRVASRSTGVDLVSGRGLLEALHGADTVIDVSKTPSLEPRLIDEFFERAGENLTSAEQEAGIRHHIMLSIVGLDRAASVPFYAAKARLEHAIRTGPVPYTVLRATQFYEFAPAIASVSRGPEGVVRLPPLLVQPVASDDVAAAVSQLVDEEPSGNCIEFAGPERFTLADFVRAAIPADAGGERILTDADASYFGGVIDRRALLPGVDARIAPTSLSDWNARQR